MASVPAELAIRPRLRALTWGNVPSEVAVGRRTGTVVVIGPQWAYAVSTIADVSPGRGPTAVAGIPARISAEAEQRRNPLNVRSGTFAAVTAGFNVRRFQPSRRSRSPLCSDEAQPVWVVLAEHLTILLEVVVCPAGERNRPVAALRIQTDQLRAVADSSELTVDHDLIGVHSRPRRPERFTLAKSKTGAVAGVAIA